MKPHEREKQAVSLVAALVMMSVMAAGPIFLIVHQGPWSPTEIAVGVGIVAAGAFSLALLLRNQRLGPEQSTLSGRFGLVIAGLGVLILLGGAAVCGWAIAEPEVSAIPPGRAFGGIAGCLLAVAYLARAIVRNLRGEEVTRDEAAPEKRRRPDHPRS